MVSQTTHAGRWGRFEQAKRESRDQLAADIRAAGHRHEQRVREAWDALQKEEREAYWVDSEQSEAA